MSEMLRIMLREFAWKRGLSEHEVYPIIRVADHKVLAFYVRGNGFVPFEAP